MGYTDPNSIMNVATGSMPPAALFDVYRDNFEWLARNAPACRVYNNANISILNATVTTVTFNSERYDIGGCHSTSPFPGRLTAPAGADGIYTIFASVAWASNATGERLHLLRLNGTTAIARDRRPAGVGAFPEAALSTEYALVAGDYVELQVYQDSGGALNLTSSANYSPELGFRWTHL